MAQDNPFTMVFDALWQLMDDSPLIDDLVLVGNKVKFNSEDDRSPLKGTIITSDLPELVLVNDGVSAVNVHMTSSTSMITRRYSWIVSTGDFRINEYLHQVEWALFVSMLNWKSIISPMIWEERTFAKRVDLVDATGGFSDAERNRGIMGWSTLWRCEVEMHFKTSDLLDLLNGGSSSGSS